MQKSDKQEFLTWFLFLVIALMMYFTITSNTDAAAGLSEPALQGLESGNIQRAINTGQLN